MCGIAGFTHRGVKDASELISRITNSLTHRGPDQQGVFSSPWVGLGAVRLKIIDLEGGNQPVLSDDGNTAIVFNGEIYNFKVLRAQLEANGHVFRSKCDTEVVLRAFLECPNETGASCWREIASELSRSTIAAPDRISFSVQN